MRLLAAILKAAEVDRLIPRSPAVGVRLRRREGALVVPLTVDEVRSLAAAAPAELEAAVVLAACTGLRQVSCSASPATVSIRSSENLWWTGRW